MLYTIMHTILIRRQVLLAVNERFDSVGEISIEVLLNRYTVYQIVYSYDTHPRLSRLVNTVS